MQNVDAKQDIEVHFYGQRKHLPSWVYTILQDESSTERPKLRNYVLEWSFKKRMLSEEQNSKLTFNSVQNLANSPKA
jgi:hypothetical protein